MLAPRPRTRTGLTLLEVIVSLAIFLMALVAIIELMNFGTERALEARFTHHAAFLCQSKLNEMAAGSIGLASAGEASFDDGGLTWNWTADCTDTDVPYVKKVTVSVYRDSGYGRQVNVTLSKMVIDPSKRGSSGDSPPVSKYATDSTDSSSGSGGGG